MKNHSLIACALITQALIALALSGCQPSGNDGVLTMTVSRGEFQVNIPASGELEAAQSTPVVVPTGLRGPQSLAWIQNNFTQSRPGMWWPGSMIPVSRFACRWKPSTLSAWRRMHRSRQRKISP